MTARCGVPHRAFHGAEVHAHGRRRGGARERPFSAPDLPARRDAAAAVHARRPARLQRGDGPRLHRRPQPQGPMSAPFDLIDAKAARELLGGGTPIPAGTLKTWTARRLIPSYALSGRVRRYSASELQEWLTARRV